MKRTIVSVAAVAALLVFVPVRQQCSTTREQRCNIIPSGQYGGAPPVDKADDQAQMYDGLTPLFVDVGRGDLPRYFKSERCSAPRGRDR